MSASQLKNQPTTVTIEDPEGGEPVRLVYVPLTRWIRNQAGATARDHNILKHGQKAADKLGADPAILEKEMARLMVRECSLAPQFDAWWDNVGVKLGEEIAKVLFADILGGNAEVAKAKN